MPTEVPVPQSASENKRPVDRFKAFGRDVKRAIVLGLTAINPRSSREAKYAAGVELYNGSLNTPPALQGRPTDNPYGEAGSADEARKRYLASLNTTQAPEPKSKPLKKAA